MPLVKEMSGKFAGSGGVTDPTKFAETKTKAELDEIKAQDEAKEAARKFNARPTLVKVSQTKGAWQKEDRTKKVSVIKRLSKRISQRISGTSKSGKASEEPGPAEEHEEEKEEVQSESEAQNAESGAEDLEPTEANPDEEEYYADNTQKRQARQVLKPWPGRN